MHLNSVQKKLHEIIYNEVCERWGGEPHWSDFKKTAEKGSVATSRVRAMDTLEHPSVSRMKLLFFGAILPSAYWLSVPISIGLFFFFDGVGIWIIAAGILAAWLAKKASYAGMCNLLIDLAKRNEEFYYYALRRGAFDF